MKGTLSVLLAALLLAGCAPTEPGSASSAPPPVEPAPGYSVQVDWDRLDSPEPTVQEDVDGGYWPNIDGEGLLPSTDYGTLLPYAGNSVHVLYEDWISPDPYSFYGLMTRDGVLVTAPVYSGVNRVSRYRQGETTYLPAYILTTAKEEWGEVNAGKRYALCALDGSWCTDFEFWSYNVVGEEVCFLGNNGLALIHTATGQRRDWSWDTLDLGQAGEERVQDLLWTDFIDGETLTPSVDGGLLLYYGSAEDWRKAPAYVFYPETGQVVQMTCAQWQEKREAWFDGNETPDPVLLAGPDGNTIVDFGGEQFPLDLPWEEDDREYVDLRRIGDLCIVDYRWKAGVPARPSYLFRLSTGEWELMDNALSFVPDQEGGDPAFLSNYHTVYTPDFELLTTGPEGYVWTTLMGDRLSVHASGSYFGCWDLSEERWVFYRNFGVVD